jgi:hypothetical protein
MVAPAVVEAQTIVQQEKKLVEQETHQLQAHHKGITVA